MDRRDFILHVSAAALGTAIGTAAKDEPVAPDAIVEKKAMSPDPWHFRWDQPMTRLTEKEAMGQVALGTPLFNMQAMEVKDAAKRPQILEQRLHQLPEPVYYLVGNARLEISLHGVRVACSPYGEHVGIDKVMGDYSICVKGWRDIKNEQDTPEARHVAEWICLNVDTGKGWEKILDHQEDWLARLCLDVRVKNMLHTATDDAKAEWNAKFRDALTHGPDRK